MCLREPQGAEKEQSGTAIDRAARHALVFFRITSRVVGQDVILRRVVNPPPKFFQIL